MDTSLKRIIAFVIDIVIVSLVVSLINLLPLDPYKDKYKDAYEKMQEFYDAYMTLTNLVTDPSGNLQTYADSFSKADTDASNCYKAMKV